MTNLTYLGRVTLTATLYVKTGLHIGAGKDTIEIGGIDNPVVKHPHTLEPYVPGSSLKGKARFLLEWAFNKVRDDGKAFGFNDADAKSTDDTDIILRLFGTAASKDSWAGGPTRLMVRDAPLNSKWAERMRMNGHLLTEDKTEVSIDRIAGKALDGGLRQTERVPAGAEFDAEFCFKLWDVKGDGGLRDRQGLAWFIQALDLIEQDSLGGSGSRGYGQVQFKDLKIKDMDGLEHSLDNSFRGHRFDPKSPPSEIMNVVTSATQIHTQVA